MRSQHLFLLTNNKNCYYLTIALWNKIQTISLCLKVKFCVFSRTGVIKIYFILRLTFLISCTLSSGLFPLLDSDSDTDSCTMQDLSICLDLDSDPLIEMYVIGMEISPWDRDLNRSSSQWKHVLHNTMCT